MSQNSNYITNFNGSASFIDIISSLSSQIEYVYTVNGTVYQDSGHYARYFYLGNLLIQFSDISPYAYGAATPNKGNITINFPINFSSTPYYIGVTPFSSNTANSPLTITYFNNVGFSVAVSNNNTYVTFIAIGPR